MAQAQRTNVSTLLVAAKAPLEAESSDGGNQNQGVGPNPGILTQSSLHTLIGGGPDRPYVCADGVNTMFCM